MATWQHLRSSTANKRPTTSLADGRIAINTNTASPGLFFKDSAGTGIVKVGPVHVGTTAPNSVPAAGGSSGNYLGEQWLDTSVSPAQMKVWNGSTWVGIVADELPVSKLQDGAPRQLIQTDAAGTGVEWTSNIDVPGTLDVTSTATFDSIAQYPLGSAGAPTITFTGDNNTGIYSPGADQVAISTGGSGRLFVDANGRVGINSAPSLWLLEVKQDSASSAGGAYPVIQVNNPNANGYAGVYLNDSTAQAGLETQRNTGHLGLQAGGSERLRITSAGLVGVGTSSPGANLHVAMPSSGTGAIFRYTGGTNNPGLYLDVSESTKNVSLYATASITSGQILQLGAAGSQNVLNITGTSVGIGTTSPGYPLEVSVNTTTIENPIAVTNLGTSGSTLGVGQLFRAYSGSAVTNIGNIFATGSTWTFSNYLANSFNIVGLNTGGVGIRAANAPIIFYNGNASADASTERARIDSSGRLLVGTSSTVRNSRLCVRGNASGSFTGDLELGAAAGYASISVDNTIGVLRFTESTNGGIFAQLYAESDGTPGNNDYPGRLVFSVTRDGQASPTESLRITNKGETAIGSTGNVLFVGTTQASGTGNYLIIGRSAVTDGSPFTTGTDRFYVYANGNVQNTNNSYGAISDIKLKENIVDATSQWNDIKALKVRKYNFKEGETHTQIGLIAQEVELVSPGLVAESPDRDAEGNDLGTVTKSVNYSVLYMKAVKALQEAMERIEALEAKVAALESA